MSLLAHSFCSKRFLFICTLLLTMACIKEGRAHGLESRIIESVGMTSTANFQYSDGSPVSFAKVKIWSPENDSIEFQNGRTDTNGRFSFFPDVDGIWRITVNDGMGHAATLKHELSHNGDRTIEQRVETSSTEGKNRLLYGFLGCSLIINAGFVIGRLKEAIPKRTHAVS